MSGTFQAGIVKVDSVSIGDNWKIELLDGSKLKFLYNGVEQMVVIPDPPSTTSRTAGNNTLTTNGNAAFVRKRVF